MGALANAAAFIAAGVLLAGAMMVLQQAMKPGRKPLSRTFGLALAASQIVGALACWGVLR